ncbi:MAG: hypothetical protein ACRDOI_37425 [Trebonia sp.]
MSAIGHYPGARLTASPALGVVLAAQRAPRFIVATGPTSRLRPVRYFAFAFGDGGEPLRGFVQEVPDRPGNDSLIEGHGILSDIYCYRLYRPGAAASCASGASRVTTSCRCRRAAQPPRAATAD